MAVVPDVKCVVVEVSFLEQLELAIRFFDVHSHGVPFFLEAGQFRLEVVEVLPVSAIVVKRLRIPHVHIVQFFYILQFLRIAFEVEFFLLEPLPIFLDEKKFLPQTCFFSFQLNKTILKILASTYKQSG
jgi:hypothetical protein